MSKGTRAESTGRRPTSSGIMPNSTMSSLVTCWSSSPNSMSRPLAGLLAETDGLLAQPPGDDVLQAHERPAADEEDVRGVHLDVLLFGMLASALGRHVGHRSFEHLQEGLLHALAGDVAGDGDVLAGLADLVDFVDVDHAPLGRLEVEVGGVQELQEQVLHVLAHVAGLGERGGVADGEGHVEDLGQGLRQERLARAGGPDQQDVGLVDDHVGDFRVVYQALVMTVHGHGQHFLGVLLPDDVLIEPGDHLAWRGDLGEGLLAGAAAAPLLLEDRLAEIDALAADVDVAGALDQRSDVAIALATERTEGVFLGGAATPSSGIEVPSRGHTHSFPQSARRGRAPQGPPQAGMSVPWSLDGPGRNTRPRPFGHPCPHLFEHSTLQFLRPACQRGFPQLPCGNGGSGQPLRSERPAQVRSSGPNLFRRYPLPPHRAAPLTSILLFGIPRR